MMKMNEWMNEWKHLYSGLLCLLYTQSAYQSWVSPQPPPVCSIHLNDATAATGQRHQCAHHTPATGGESESQSSGWGLLGGHDWQGLVEGIWPGHRGYTPTLYEKCNGIFIDQRVRTSVGLKEHSVFLKIGSFYISSRVKQLSFTLFESIQPISGSGGSNFSLA